MSWSYLMKGPARFQRVSVVVDLGCEDVHASGCSVMLNDISSETLAETIAWFPLTTSDLIPFLNRP